MPGIIMTITAAVLAVIFICLTVAIAIAKKQDEMWQPVQKVLLIAFVIAVGGDIVTGGLIGANISGIFLEILSSITSGA